MEDPEIDLRIPIFLCGSGGGGGAGPILGAGAGCIDSEANKKMAFKSVNMMIAGYFAKQQRFAQKARREKLMHEVIFEGPVNRAIILLQSVLSNSGVDKGHGLDHALKVLHNTDQALKHIVLPPRTVQAVRLASLLHDADDRKFFPKGSDNARQILEKVLGGYSGTQVLVLKMIDLVSCSKNGIGRDSEGIEWMLYPRWSDRLESLGHTGILRAYQYTLHRRRPLENSETPKTNTKDILYLFIVTPERFATYLKTKESATFIDHFYDKLLHLRNGFTTKNPYYASEIKKRHQVMEDFILEYNFAPSAQDLVDRYFSISKELTIRQ